MGRKESNPIKLRRSDVVAVIKHLSTIVVSLDRIGSMAPGIGEKAVDEMTIAFLRDWKVFARLAECRALLSDAFSSELGPDDMDELEREMQGNCYWNPPTRHNAKTIPMTNKTAWVPRGRPKNVVAK